MPQSARNIAILLARFRVVCEAITAYKNFNDYKFFEQVTRDT